MTDFRASGEAVADRARRPARRGVPSTPAKPRERWTHRHGVREARRRARTGRAVPLLGPPGHRDAAAGAGRPLRVGAEGGERADDRPASRGGRIDHARAGRSGRALGRAPLPHPARDPRRAGDARARARARSARELDIAFLGLGIQPRSARSRRSSGCRSSATRIMGAYMLRVGTLGHRMMKQTATVQANIDYADERDAMRKLRVGMATAPPIVNAMFANSSISEAPAERSAELPRPRLDRHRPGALRAPAVRVPRRRVVRGLRRVGARRAALLRPARWPLPDRRHRHAVPALPRLRRSTASAATMDDWQLAPDDALPRGAAEGLHRAPIRRQPAARTGSWGCRRWLKGLFYEADCVSAAVDLVKRWWFDDVLDLYRDVTCASAWRRGSGGSALLELRARAARDRRAKACAASVLWMRRVGTSASTSNP